MIFDDNHEPQPDPMEDDPAPSTEGPGTYHKPVTYSLGKDFDPYAESLAHALQNADLRCSDEDERPACEDEHHASWETQDPFYCGGEYLALRCQTL